MNCKTYTSQSYNEWEGFIYDQQQQQTPLYRMNDLTTVKYRKPIESLKIYETRANSNQQLKLNNFMKSQQLNQITKENFFLNERSTQKIITNQYAEVQVIRIDDKTYNNGLLIYKGFRPKTTDKYFKLLQEINLFNPQIKQLHIKNLVFSSKFECGNLDAVYKKADNLYDLYMKVDTNTKGHMQWYYFSVKNRKSCKVIFNINYFTKHLSLYQRGMKPYVLSRRQYQTKGIGWIQDGYNVQYVPQSLEETNKKYILKFQYQFKNQNDEIYFAACPPYSYTYLNKQIQCFKTNSKYNFKVDSSAKTFGGLNIPIITISSNKPINQKKYLIIIARTHPGQSSSSWVMDGIMSSFLTESENLNILMNSVILKLIPMINPDGVFLGNYRTGILGTDLNRNFCSGKNNLYPQISIVKKLVKQLKSQGKIIGFIDLHGHSILRNCFIFGSAKEEYLETQMNQFTNKLESKSKYFKMKSCRFLNQEQKIETARIYFQVKQKIPSFTIENSLGLYTSHNKHSNPFFTTDWIKFGNQIVEALADIIIERPTKNIKNIKQQDKIDQFQIRTQIRNKLYYKVNKGFQKDILITKKFNSQKFYNLKFKCKYLYKKNTNFLIQKDITKNIIDIQSDETQKQVQSNDNISENYEQSINDQQSSSQDLPKQIYNSFIKEVEEMTEKRQITKRKRDISRFQNKFNLTQIKVQRKKKEERYASNKFREIQLVLNFHNLKDQYQKSNNKSKTRKYQYVRQQSIREQPINYQKFQNYKKNYNYQKSEQSMIFNEKKILENMKLTNIRNKFQY